MLTLRFSSLVLASLTGLTVFISSESSQAGSVEYKCDLESGSPVTLAVTPKGKIDLIVWKRQFFSNSGYTPEKRCQEVSARFQRFSDNGSLRFVTTGRLKNQNVMCVTRSKARPSCDSKGLLLTFEPTDKPEEVLKQLFDLSNRASGDGRGIVRAAGEQVVIDMQQFLEAAPARN